MELIVNKQPVFIHETLLEADLEQSVECDVLLPDYCPDIQKILKCTLVPTLSRREVEDDRLILEGICLATVYYRNPEGELCRSEYKIPFSKTAELKDEAVCPAVWVQSSCSYVNCRAVSSRRIDIRGAVNLRVCVSNMKEEQAVSAAGGMGMQLRQQVRTATRTIMQTCKTISLCEDTELPENKGGIGAILRVGATTKLLDSKIIAGKVILRGEANVNFLYRNLEGNCETMEFTLPISQMIDCEKADDTCRCFARLSLQNAFVEKRCETHGEEHLLSISCNVNAHVHVHKDYEALCASDCYSTHYECGCQTKMTNTLELAQTVERCFMYRDRMELPQGVSRVVDLWCQITDWNVHFEGADALIMGKLCISLFGQENGGEVEYYEKMVEFEDRIPLGEQLASHGGVIFHPNLWVVGQGYNFGSDCTLDVRCEIGVSGCVYRCCNTAMIYELSLNEERPKQSRVEKGLYVCIAEAGEELWDIAKRYNTSIDQIVEENELTAEAVQRRTMLIVPVL